MEPYKKLEQEWAWFNDLDPQRMVACSSGTAALHLAVECLNYTCIGKCSVAVPDFTMYACARAVVMGRATPVFVDCKDDLTINAECIPKDVHTIMAVHIYGRMCDMDAIHSFDRPVIEDMAEVHGFRPHPRTEAATWSFYRNKIVGGEEGGAVYFKQKKYADLARQLRTLGFTEQHDFMHAPYGSNYRMANCCAELVLRSIKKYNPNVTKRRANEVLFDAAFSKHWHMPRRSAPWVYDLRIPGLSRQNQYHLVGVLQEYGARHSFKPMTHQPEFEGYRCSVGKYKDMKHKAALLAQEIIYLPLTLGVQRTKLAASRLIAEYNRL